MTYVTSGYLVRRIEMAKKPNLMYIARKSIEQRKARKRCRTMTILASRHIRDILESIVKIGLSIEEKPRATPLSSLEAYIPEVRCTSARRRQHWWASGSSRELWRDHP